MYIWGFPAQSQGNPEPNKSYPSTWVTSASCPFSAPVSSNMIWLKVPKVDQLPILIYEPHGLYCRKQWIVYWVLFGSVGYH